MEVESFGEIEQEFLARVHGIVWCNVASVDAKGRPRSRILHTIWEVTGSGPVGWVATRRKTLKAAHFARNPYVSLAYIGDPSKPVYADCKAGWDESLEEKKRVWNLFKSAEPPLGYDPAPVFYSPGHEDFGLLKLVPWRIEVTDVNIVPPVKLVWHAKDNTGNEE